MRVRCSEDDRRFPSFAAGVDAAALGGTAILIAAPTLMGPRLAHRTTFMRSDGGRWGVTVVVGGRG